VPPTPAAKPPPRRGHGRRPLPGHLPRERIEHDLAEAEKACPCCGRTRVRIGSETSEQLDYTLGNRAALSRSTEAGFLQIDNNACERTLQAVAVGRGNWTFVGSESGGKTAAVMYSVTGTCCRLGVDPWAYLRDVFARLPGLPANRLDELLPDRWAKERASAIR
jgi:transposase